MQVVIKASSHPFCAGVVPRPVGWGGVGSVVGNGGVGGYSADRTLSRSGKFKLPHVFQ